MLMKALLLSLSHWQVRGKENVPREGPLIVATNHLSLIDPPLLSASIPRQIVFMAKEELFRSPRGSFFVRAFGAFPVRRGELDREAVRQALMVLQAGQVLGMFPEGKRSSNAKLQAAQAGASFIASRSGAPILPVGISGSENVSGLGFILKRPAITVAIGRPFSLPSIQEGQIGRQLGELTALTMGRIAELLPQSYKGGYSD